MVHNCLLLMSNANNIHKKRGGGGGTAPVAKLNAVGWGVNGGRSPL